MTNTDNYLQIAVSVDRPQADDVEDALLNFGALSCTFEDAADTPILEPEPGSTPLWNAVVITGLFADSADCELVARLLLNEVPALNREHIVFKDLQGRHWERAWMDDFKPLKIDDRMWIVPSFCEAPDADAINVVIDPGLAFGSGTHSTTALCLRWLGKQKLRDKTVIDYGCGSGILAVAAAMLGAKAIYAYDIDPQALLATGQNAQRNNVSESIHICTHDRQLPEGVDLIVANILLAPLLDLPARFSALLSDEGRLGMSGVLADQVGSLAGAYATGFQHCETELDEQWVLYSAKKRGTLRS